MKKIFSILSFVLLGIFIYINFFSIDKNFQFLKKLLNEENRYFIKKIFFPYKYISQLESHMIHQTVGSAYIIPSSLLIKKELDFKKKKIDIQIIKNKKKFQISKNKILKKYNLVGGFYYGINQISPGTGYIDFYQNNLIILSSRGVLSFVKDIENESSLKQIENNIEDFINSKQYEKGIWFSLKDLLIYNNRIFVSYTEEIKKNCWNTSIIYANMNYDNIKFEKLFSSKECIHNIVNVDSRFNAYQSGGRIVGFDNEHILLTVGEYRSRYLAQEEKNINGKIIKVKIIKNNPDFEVISIGHRNPQGLYFDKDKNFLLETEHGPKGGDEINLIELDNLNKEKVLNYGWPIVSYGDHYPQNEKEHKETYKKYPLYKSHSKYGFIEPIEFFTPSIAISEITKIGKNRYVASSMKSSSLFFFELDNKKIINLDRVSVFDRIRDLKFDNGKLFLFLEDSASIGIINLN